MLLVSLSLLYFTAATLLSLLWSKTRLLFHRSHWIVSAHCFKRVILMLLSSLSLLYFIAICFVTPYCHRFRRSSVRWLTLSQYIALDITFKDVFYSRRRHNQQSNFNKKCFLFQREIKISFIWTVPRKWHPFEGLCELYNPVTSLSLPLRKIWRVICLELNPRPLISLGFSAVHRWTGDRLDYSSISRMFLT